MPAKPEYPRLIKHGPVVLKVYRVVHRSTASGVAFVLSWSSAGHRKLQQFASEDEAMAEGRLKAAHIAAGRAEMADVSASEREEMRVARELCGDTPLLSALQEWQRARDLTGGSIIAAAEAWASRVTETLDEISIRQAVADFIAAKERTGVDVKASYQKVLPTLVTAFGERSLRSVSARELNAWMETRHPNPVTRNTVRKRLVTLWRWARKQGYLPRDAISEAEHTDTAREQDAAIGVISGQTYAALLARFRAKHPEYLAPLAIAGFCGLRRSEIHAQTWEDVHLDRKFVRVTAAKRNTPGRRLVPLCEAAIAWLKLCKHRQGALCTNMAMDRIRDIARGDNFELPDNCFRHSFISHRVAQTGNVAETALEAGNSPQIIFRHYRELVTKEEGEAWFRITPNIRERRASRDAATKKRESPLPRVARGGDQLTERTAAATSIRVSRSSGTAAREPVV